MIKNVNFPKELMSKIQEKADNEHRSFVSQVLNDLCGIYMSKEDRFRESEGNDRDS